MKGNLAIGTIETAISIDQKQYQQFHMAKLNTMYLHTKQNAAAEPAFNNYKLQLSEIRKQGEKMLT